MVVNLTLMRWLEEPLIGYETNLVIRFSQSANRTYATGDLPLPGNKEEVAASARLTALSTQDASVSLRADTEVTARSDAAAADGERLDVFKRRKFKTKRRVRERPQSDSDGWRFKMQSDAVRTRVCTFCMYCVCPDSVCLSTLYQYYIVRTHIYLISYLCYSILCASLLMVIPHTWRTMYVCTCALVIGSVTHQILHIMTRKVWWCV